MILKAQVIDAAKAAIDVSDFTIARDMLENGDVKLCVLCLKRPAAAFCYFRNERLPVCHDCLGNRLASNEVTRIGAHTGIPSGQVWVLDYLHRKHYVTPEARRPRREHAEHVDTRERCGALGHDGSDHDL